MADQNVILRLTESCDIFFDGSLISKELIIKKYADFLGEVITPENRQSSVALHTGSMCFDIVSFLMAALACVFKDQTDPDEIIASLSDGDMVLYKDKRHRWRGLEMRDNQRYMKLEQDESGKSGGLLTLCPFEASKSLIKPYYGTSGVTDGRGIKKKKTNRSDFISFVTGKDESDIPGITGVSTVIVADKTLFDRIQKGLSISYNGKNIRLLDIVPASYYTDGDEPYQFGSNPSKSEPVLKITGKVSIARDLVLDKRGNRAIGLMIIGSEVASKGSSELEDLLGRKSLKFTHISMRIDSINADNYIGDDKSTLIFACTKEFLLQNSKPISTSNLFTKELDRQIENIVSNETTMEIIGGGCSWDLYKKVRNALFVIKQSEWDDEHKKNFIVAAHSLLNLFTTAVFPMTTLEQAITNTELHIGIFSPLERIEELWRIAEKSGSFEGQCLLVVSALDNLYKSIKSGSPKGQVLREVLNDATREKIAIIVPKAYYTDILRKEFLFDRDNVHLVTANRFDASQYYDKVIVVGDFCGKRFDALKCKTAANVIVLLYECETHWFKRRKLESLKFERKLNEIIGITEDFDDTEINESEIDEDAVVQFENETFDLEEYVDTVSIFDIQKFVARLSSYDRNVAMSEISAIGKFIGGGQIMFSKFYKAVVYNPLNTKAPISETDVEKLTIGDNLVFTKRDDFTRNIVDEIYEALRTSGKLSKDVLKATEMSLWWKEVLRDYQQTHNLTYRQLAKELNQYGNSLTEVAVRQWLVAESHIIGPREESSLRQIAEMTRDPYLLCDTSGYFNACGTVRRQRRKILKLIGKAIEDKLSGNHPSHGSELEIVYDNVENLSETLELETITFLEEALSVPINIVNKPISDMEVLS